jgi:pyridoxal phosphate enzyme (YggS family)
VSLEADIRGRLRSVRARMTRAAEAAGRDPSAIRLVAVSKTFDVAHVTAAAGAGQVDFGENRVQEAAEKIERVALPLRWHLVGHLQSNKVRRAASLFACIQSVDSIDVLRRLERAAVETGTTPEVLVQVDLAGEATKHGARPEDLEHLFAEAAACHAVRVTGLMTLPPFFDDPEQARPYFDRLRTLREELRARDMPAAMLRELSMGMSHDFEVAIQEGATVVRVGTAIFGERG